MGNRLESTHPKKCGNWSLEANQVVLRLQNKPNSVIFIMIAYTHSMISFHSEDGQNHLWNKPMVRTNIMDILLMDWMYLIQIQKKSNDKKWSFIKINHRKIAFQRLRKYSPHFDLEYSNILNINNHFWATLRGRH